ncbi:MAG: F0F1 ATP synthase subunit delta [Deltaproteobacteria bacterium]|nr:F0F1 ATP synthase subunit delta [Deltaproteobacteria bacterium]
MLIDWFTVVAQVINFLVLLALLKWLLYGRVIKAMDQREADIAQRLAKADQEKENATLERQKLVAEREDLAQSREREMATAQEEARAQKEKLLREARGEVEQDSRAWREELRRQREELARHLAQAAAEQALAVSRQTLAGLTGQGDLAGAVERFLDELANLDQNQVRELAEAAGQGGVTITSARDLSEDDEQRLRRAVEELAAGPYDVAFKTDPELLLGLTLTAPGVRLAWSAAEYLEDLREVVREALDRELREGSQVRQAGDNQPANGGD